MKKSTRYFSLLLAVVLMLGMLSACGKEEDKATTDDTITKTTTEDSKQSEDTDTVVEDNAEDQTESEETSFFPLEETVTYTVWTLDNAGGTLGYEETDTATLMETATNVHLEVAWVTAAEVKEKFGLMIASGDIPDIVMKAGNYYSGGVQQAVADGLFHDMTDLVPQYMPNYHSLISNNDEVKKSITMDDGHMYAIYSVNADLYDASKPEKELLKMGLGIRQDMLEKVGLDVPVTIDDWTEVLTAFKGLGMEAPLMIGSNGTVSSGAFMSAYGILPGFYLDGNTVKFNAAEEGFKAYLQQMKDWYDAGLLDPNFVTNNRIYFLDVADLVNDSTGAGQIYWSHAGRALKDYGYEISDDYYLAFAPYPVLNEGDTAYRGVVSTSVSDHGCISVDVTGERLETLLKYLDFMYTEEAMRYRVIGEEGVHYTIGEDGTIAFTDMMMKDPDFGPNIMCDRHLNRVATPGLTLTQRGLYSLTYPDGFAATDMQPIWNEASEAMFYPTDAALTGNETTEYNTLYVNISTLVDEMSAKFIMGVESLDNYDAFVEKLYEYGLQTCIDYKQAAYDRYLNR